MDTTTIEYRIAAIGQGGARRYLEGFLVDLSWEDVDEELAARCTASFLNERDGGKRIAQLLPNGTEIRVYAGEPGDYEERFRGRIFSNTSSWSGEQSTHDIVAYDPLFYLRSEDERYYKAGQSATDIIRDVLDAWDVPHEDLKGPKVALSRKMLLGEGIDTLISRALKETKHKGGGRWLLLHREGKAYLDQRGTNKRIITIAAEDTHDLVISRSIEELITKVKVVGRKKDGGKVLATATSDLLKDYGTIQRIVHASDYDKASGAEKAAKAILKEEGVELKDRLVTAPDDPYVRKGHRHRIRTATLDGSHIVKSVTHSATDRKMYLLLDGPPDEDDVDITYRDSGLDAWQADSGEKFTGDAGKALGFQSSAVLRGPDWVYERAAIAAKAAGGGFFITSWMRPGAVTASGTTSDHANGHALDIKGGDLDRLARELRKTPNFKQLIWPDPDSDGDGVHLHIAWTGP